MSWNIQSKNCSIRGNKFDIQDFTKIINKCHVVCLQEIRKDVEHKFFLALNNIRPAKRAGGGFSILIHKSLVPHTTHLKCKKGSHITAIRISKVYLGSSSDLIIVRCYIIISPSNTPYRLNNSIDPWDFLNDQVTKLITKNSADIIICGDFNAQTANLNDTIRQHKPSQTNT